SPDGTNLAETHDNDVWVMDLSGNETQVTATTQRAEFGTPRWSPDGSQLIVAATTTDSQHIYLMAETPGTAVEENAETVAPGTTAGENPDWERTNVSSISGAPD